MTQRNPMNPRSQNKSYAGVSRKSASSAKPVREAGASLTAPSKTKKEKERKAKEKAETKQERKREAVMGARVSELPEYKRWRRNWIITIALAAVGVGVSWAVSALASNGALPAVLAPYEEWIIYGFLILGYAMIIVAVVIDWRKIRPIRRGQEARAKRLTKRERRQLDEAIAASEADEKKSKSSSLPWKKGSEAASDGK